MKKTITIVATLLLTISAIAAVPASRQSAKPAERPVAVTPVAAMPVSASAYSVSDYRLERESCCGPQQ